MSRKAKTFRHTTLLPQVSCNYQIMIPWIARSLFAVETASLPFKKVQSASIFVRGIEYKIPVKQTAQGQWTCTLYENMFMSALYQTLAQWKNDIDFNVGTTNYGADFGLGKIIIFITDALTGDAPVAQCILDDCYITDIRELSLSAAGANEPMKISVTFQYNNILDPIETAENIMLASKYMPQLMPGGVALNTASAWSAEKITGFIKDKLNIKEMFEGMM